MKGLSMSLKEGNRTALIGIGVMAGVLQVIAGVAMYLAGVYFKPWSMLVTGGGFTSLHCSWHALVFS
jgi:hypothetical protein